MHPDIAAFPNEWFYASEQLQPVPLPHRDVIIYAFGVQDQADLDFLTSNCFVEDGHTIDRKLNVAMTRARKQLLMTGCQQVLSQNPIYAKLIYRYYI